VSAVSGQGLDEMFAAIAQALSVEKTREVLTLSFAEGKGRAWLFKEGVVESEEQTEDGFEITVLWSPKQRAQFEGL
ncbi:MAG: GTPase HflX, partial [Shimia sp.]|nr:GTPase HflX [Shimia sp.]